MRRIPIGVGSFIRYMCLTWTLISIFSLQIKRNSNQWRLANVRRQIYANKNRWNQIFKVLYLKLCSEFHMLPQTCWMNGHNHKLGFKEHTMVRASCDGDNENVIH